MSKNDTTSSNEITQPVKPYYNSLNLPPKVEFNSKKPTKTQVSPYDAKSPQEVLQQYGMYKDEHAFNNETAPHYLDLVNMGDYESNLNAIREMKEKFNSLDIDVRARFNHNLDEFCKYCRSDKFDVKNLLPDSQLDNYNKYKEEQKNKKAYEKYLLSDEYKNAIQEQALRQAYEQKMYEEWKKTQNPVT